MFLHSSLWAQPDFSIYRQVGDLRAFSDHKDRSIWYLAPPPPRLAVDEDGAPAYSLDIYAYQGRKATGDQGLFWQKIILSLSFERSWPPESKERLRRALRNEFGKGITLKTLPIQGARVRLLFADRVYERHLKVRWRPERLVLPLDDYLGALLWEAAKRGQVLISLDVEEESFGFKRQKDQGLVQTRYSWHWVLPVLFDFNRYPQKFRLHDLGAKLARAYTQIDVFCLDFVEQTLPGLYLTIVEIGFPVRGRLLLKRVRFQEGGDYHQKVIFPLAHEVDKPYRFRIIRIFSDGSTKESPWQERYGERLLDVTFYRNSQEEKR